MQALAPRPAWHAWPCQWTAHDHCTLNPLWICEVFSQDHQLQNQKVWDGPQTQRRRRGLSPREVSPSANKTGGSASVYSSLRSIEVTVPQPCSNLTAPSEPCLLRHMPQRVPSLLLGTPCTWRTMHSHSIPHAHAEESAVNVRYVAPAINVCHLLDICLLQEVKGLQSHQGRSTHIMLILFGRRPQKATETCSHTPPTAPSPWLHGAGVIVSH